MPFDVHFWERKIYDITLKLDVLYGTIVEMEVITLKNIYKILDKSMI